MSADDERGGARIMKATAQGAGHEAITGTPGGPEGSLLGRTEERYPNLGVRFDVTAQLEVSRGS